MIALLAMSLAMRPGFTTDSGDVPVKESRKMVRAYAECVVKNRPADASAATLSVAGNEELMKAYPKIADPDCITGRVGSMAFAGDLLRYALADVLVGKELASRPPLDVANITAIDHYAPVSPPSQLDERGRPLKKKKYEQRLQWFATAVAYSQVSRFGDCVVRTNPVGARAVLLTEVTSPTEGAAMAALKPALGHCLVKGEQLALTKEVLRGTLALNYYRLSRAPRQQASTQ